VTIAPGHGADALPYQGDAPATPAQAISIVTAWVPSGTPVPAAIATMRNHGFRCDLHREASFGGEEHLDYIACQRDYGGPSIYERWQVALVLARLPLLGKKRSNF